jgi:hypothetical protein
MPIVIKTKIPIIIIQILSILSIIAGVSLTFIPDLIDYMGNYLLVLQLPLIAGGVGSLIGSLVVKINPSLSRWLLYIGSVLGIITILNIVFISHTSYSISGSPDRRESKTTVFRSLAASRFLKILFLPVLMSYLMIVVFIIDTADKAGIPLSWRGRNGLSFIDTIWDTDVFWGELWFNLLLIFIITALLLIKLRNSSSLHRLSQKNSNKIILYSGIVSLVILMLMALTWQPSFSILDNWFSTQFAYQVVTWPALIGVLGLFIFSIRINQSRQKTLEKTPTNKMIHYTFATLFLGCSFVIWLFLITITNFDPHAIFNFAMPTYIFLMTTFYLLPFLSLTIQKILKIRGEENELVPSNNANKGPEIGINNYTTVTQDKASISTSIKSHLNIILSLIVFITGIVLILVLQIMGSQTIPLIASEQMFSLDLVWWWPFSHWPSWVFIISTSIFLTFAAQRVQIGLLQKLETPAESTLESSHKNRKGILVHAQIINKILAVALGVIVLISTFAPVFAIKTQWDSLNTPLVLINQIGYLPNSPKRVLFQDTVDADLPLTADFDLLNVTSNHVVYSGILEKNVTRYGHSYMVGEFGDFICEGEFFIHVNVSNRYFNSPKFAINQDVYKLAVERAMRFFYYQRCNYQVEEIVPGYLGHNACHMNDAEVWNGTDWIYHNLQGGWHDAGDYNKYNSWFQTQWYCVQALAESALINPDNLYSEFSDLTDSELPDVIDEALWGALYLVNCVNEEGIQGMDKQYMVWETVSGYRQYEDREARMSYWGPPELDWTTPRRVVFNQWSSTFVGYNRGYDVAATLLQIARLIDNYTAQYPGVEFPDWAIIDTTYLRELADNVYNKYISLQGATADGMETYAGKFLYWQEKCIIDGYDWTTLDAMIPTIISGITDIASYHLWFSWADYYVLGNILTHYLTFDRPIPIVVSDKIVSIQNNHFATLFDEPFRVKHSIFEGNHILFYGAERQTDMLTSAWLQALMIQANQTVVRPQLVQSLLDWLFGVNPAGICMLESLGTRNFPQYHHRYSYARNPNGAVPGALPNGMAQIRCSKEYLAGYSLEYEDESFYELFGDVGMIATWEGNPLLKDGVPSNPNEVWIPHNAMLLKLFTIIDEYQIL